MDLQLTGKIKVIGQVQTFDSGFSKRELVVTTAEQYPQDVSFDFFKDKTSILDKYTIGDDVEVAFNIRGNEYNGKHYVNLQAWKIGKIEATNTPLPTAPPVKEAGTDDDLPF